MVRRSLIRWVMVWTSIVGIIGVLAQPLAATGHAASPTPDTRCDVVLSPFPLTNTQHARRPQIVYFAARNELYIATAIVDPTSTSWDGTAVGVVQPTVWRARPWTIVQQRTFWPGTDRLRTPDAYPTRLAYVREGERSGILFDHVILEWTEETPTRTSGLHLTYSPVLNDEGMVTYLGLVWPFFVSAMQPLPLPQPDSSNADLVWVGRLALDSAGETFGWGYRYQRFGDGWTGIHPYLSAWLIREAADHDQPYTTTVFAPPEEEAPAMARSEDAIAHAALTELRADHERRIGIWRFDPEAIETLSPFVSDETRPAWQRWSVVPGWGTNPSLAFHGTTMFVTYRDATNRPMLAWTTTDAPDGWQTLMLDEHAAEGQIHLVVDAPRYRYVAVWTRRGPAMDGSDNQLVMLHGLLETPTIHSTPVAITTPGPWSNPQAAINRFGDIHLVADYAPAGGQARPHLLTLPIRWTGPTTLPAHPTHAQTGVFAWDPYVSMWREEIRVTLQSATGSVEVWDATMNGAMIPATNRPAGPALVTGTWEGCEGLPLGGVQVIPPPPVAYTSATLTVAEQNPTEGTIRLANAVTDVQVWFTGEVQVQDAAGNVHRRNCRVSLAMINGDLAGRCYLPSTTAMTNGQATVTITGTLIDVLDQQVAMTPATITLTAPTEFRRYAVFVPVVTR